MLQGDPKERMVKKEVESVKRSTSLYGEMQKDEFSGHGSADYGSGPPQNAAVPKGSPGTGNSHSY